MSITRTLAAALAICAIAAPVAAAQPADMHASTAIAAAKERAKQDLRSPDARDAAATTAPKGQDLRTPDARDAAIHLHRSHLVVGATQPVAAKPAPAPVAKSTDDGIDWLTVGLGIAGSLFAVIGIALISSRRQMPPLRPSA
jgi:mannose/fructose/N-acetylgalactosamine-specific phosphotransferase system component IIC